MLIDEARTPLIISGPQEDDLSVYPRFARLVPTLTRDVHYTVDERTRSVHLTEDGIEQLERGLGVENIYAQENFRLTRYMEAALKAQIIYQRDRDYVVKDGEVIIVDDFTGRLMEGRRWSDGLHQAVEAKEGVKIQQESVTYATITLQNFFRMYDKLAGMTGTAATEAEELAEIYKLEVLVIPTNREMVREDFPDFVYRDTRAKFKAVVERRRREARAGPADPRGDGVDRDVRGAVGPVAASRHRARGAEREAARARGDDRGAGGPARGGDDRDEHGRARDGHQARGGRGWPRRAAHHRHGAA